MGLARAPAAWRKWSALGKVWLQDGLAYRANVVIWSLTDAVPALIMPLVFIAAMPSGGDIRGFTASGFVLYYVTMFVITNFVTSHLMWDLANDIKEGVFTTHLLRPISYFQVCFIRNVTWRLLRLTFLAPILAVMLLVFRGYLSEAELHFGWHVAAAILMGHVVSFTFVFMMSMLALFFQETESIFGLYYFPMLFLSGQLFPVSLLPDWAETAARFFPFYYTTALPTEMLVGRLSPDALPGMLGIQLGWIVLHMLLARLLWRFGLRHYTGVGM